MVDITVTAKAMGMKFPIDLSFVSSPQDGEIKVAGSSDLLGSKSIKISEQDAKGLVERLTVAIQTIDADYNP